jgi:hypothetical protein
LLSSTRTKQETKQVIKQVGLTKQKLKIALKQLPRSALNRKQIVNLKKIGLQANKSRPKLFGFPRRKARTKVGSRRGSNIGYNVYGKNRTGRFSKLNKKPLSESDARNLGSYAIDNRISRTFFIRRVGSFKNLGKINAKAKGYFSRFKYKFRAYKIKKGKRVAFTKKRYIEKAKYSLDRPSERRDILLRRLKKARRVLAMRRSRGFLPRFKARRNRPSMNRPKRRISAAQRRVLLMRLAKARKVRMRNLRGRRR